LLSDRSKGDMKEAALIRSGTPHLRENWRNSRARLIALEQVLAENSLLEYA
jgi:hypothetical protein